MYVCTSACLYVCLSVCLFVWLYVCMHVCLYFCIFVCMFVCFPVCMCKCSFFVLFLGRVIEHGHKQVQYVLELFCVARMLQVKQWKCRVLLCLQAYTLLTSDEQNKKMAALLVRDAQLSVQQSEQSDTRAHAGNVSSSIMFYSWFLFMIWLVI